MKTGRHRAFWVLVVSAALLALAIPAAASADSGKSGAHDTDPHIPLTAAQETVLKAKIATVYTYMHGNRPALASNSVLMYHYAEGGSGTYCGPAAVEMVNNAAGLPSITQAAAADLLETDSDGTDWTRYYMTEYTLYLKPGSWATGHPMADTLNYLFNDPNKYVQYELSDNPTSLEKADFEADLVTEIDYLQEAMVGDAWEYPNLPHLNGHPLDYEIFHWLPIYGYGSSGDTAWYMDSVYGATGSWTLKYNISGPTQNISTSKLATILGGRGYVW